MKARVGAWTFRIVEVARPGLGSLSFGLSLSLSRTLSIAYRRHGSRISAWRRMAVVRTAYAARRERESSPAFDDPVWHPRALRGGGAVGNALTRESQAHLERNGAVLLLVRHRSDRFRVGRRRVGFRVVRTSASDVLHRYVQPRSAVPWAQSSRRIPYIHTYIRTPLSTSYGPDARGMSHPSNARLRSAVYTTIYTLYTAQRHPS